MEKKIVKFAIGSVIFGIAMEAISYILGGKEIMDWQALAVGILVAGGIFFASPEKVETHIHIISNPDPEEEEQEKEEKED